MYYLHSLNIYTAMYYGHKKATTLSILLTWSSFNYWKYPLKSSNRRTIDMIVANICVPYHIYISFFTKNKLLCSTPLLLGASMYPTSIIINKYKYQKTAAVCHCLLHLFVIIGATLTYRDYYLQSIL